MKFHHSKLNASQNPVFGQIFIPLAIVHKIVIQKYDQNRKPWREQIRNCNINYDQNESLRDDFDFDIVYFPFLGGDVPSTTSYGACMSQLIGFALLACLVIWLVIKH